MPRQMDQPILLPVLSSGRHRSPRSGACFMEFASYLAGEKWSDHPECTHGGLANLARMVNDCVSDETRNGLAPLIPSVIGLTTDDSRLDLVLAIAAASAALPVAAEERQRSLAIAAIVCRSHLERSGSPVDYAPQLEAAFQTAPDAERWALTFVDKYARRVPKRITARHAQAIVQGAVDSIALACVRDNDDRLVALLREGIETSRQFIDSVAGLPPYLEGSTPRRFSRTKVRASASA